MPFAVKSYDWGIPMLFIRDKTTSVGYIYNGWAVPGTTKAASRWRIQRETLDADGDTIEIAWANASADEWAVWNSRATYTYTIS